MPALPFKFALTSFNAFLAAAVVAVALVAGLIFDPLADLFTASAFYFIIAALTLVGMHFHSQSQQLAATIRQHQTDIAIAGALGIALMAIIFMAVGADFRVLADETNLLSTSQGLFESLELRNITQVQHYYESAHIVKAAPAHRPGLFATLTSLLHFTFGYQWYHGFVLNFIVGVISIGAAYLIFNQLAGRLFGVIAALLLASFPMFALNASSSGFDALNMLMIMLLYWQLFRFLQQPDARGVQLLLLLLLLAAQVRYETALLGVPVAIAIALQGRQLWQWQYSRFFALIPLLYLPIVWQKLVSSHFANPGDNKDPFTLENIGHNVVHMLEFFSDWNNKGLPTLRLTAALALVGLLVMAYKHWRGSWKGQWQKSVWIALGLCLLGQILVSCIHFAYYMGDYQQPWLNRWSQTQLVWLIPLAALALHTLLAQINNKVISSVVLALFMIHGTHAAMLNPVGKNLNLYRQYKQVRTWLQDNYDTRGTLVISRRSGMYAALGYSALNPDSADERQQSLKSNLQRGLYQQILFVTTYNHRKKENSEQPPKGFKAAKLVDFQYGGSSSARVYGLTVRK